MKKALLALLLTLLFSGIFFIDADGVLIGDGGDNYEFLGFMNIAKENLLDGKYPFSKTDILRYPVGFEFSYGFDGVFSVFTGAVLSIFLGPIISYNFTIVLILFLNIYISFVFFKKISELSGVDQNDDLKSLLAALIFGASPYVFARINSHLNLAFVVGIPMLTYYIVNLNNKVIHKSEEISSKEIFMLGASVVLIGLGSLQYLILLLLVSPVILSIILYKHNLSNYVWFFKKYLKQTITALATFCALFYIVWFGYINAFLANNLVMSDPLEKFTKPHLADVVVPNKYLGEVWGVVNPSSMSIEKVITVGIVEMGILFYIIFKIKNRKIKFIGLGVFLIYLFLSFGVWEIAIYPEGGRTVILLSLFISLVLVSQKDLFKNPVVVGLLLTLVLIERLFFNIQTTEPLVAKELSQEIRKLSGSAVLNVPLSKYSPYRSALPVFYNKKVLDGFFHYTAADVASEQVFEEKHFGRFICATEREDAPDTVFTYGERQEALDEFKQKDISAVVIFKDKKVGKFLFPECENVRDWWYYLNPGTLVLSKTSQEVVKDSIEIRDYNPRTIARVYFEREGRFVLDGIYITPEEYVDITIRLPNGEILSPDWQKQDGGLSTKFDPPIEVYGKAGDSIIIESDKKSQESRYISIYYLFEPSRCSLEKKPVPLELLYSDYDVEIYKVNY